eukprot:299463-Pleurochrysis_carterae.AAC.1
MPLHEYRVSPGYPLCSVPKRSVLSVGTRALTSSRSRWRGQPQRMAWLSTGRLHQQLLIRQSQMRDELRKLSPVHVRTRGRAVAAAVHGQVLVERGADAVHQRVRREARRRLGAREGSAASAALWPTHARTHAHARA